MKSLFAAIIIILFAGSASALAEVAYFAGERNCPGTLEQEVAVLTVITADFDGQQSYEWVQPMPATPSPENLKNAVFVVGGDGGNAWLYANNAWLGQFGIGNFDAPMHTTLMGSDRFGATYKELLVEGDNDIELVLLSPQPSIKQGDVVASFAGTVCSTELASSLPHFPTDVPEFTPSLMVVGALGAVGLLFIIRR